MEGLDSSPIKPCYISKIGIKEGLLVMEINHLFRNIPNSKLIKLEESLQSTKTYYSSVYDTIPFEFSGRKYNTTFDNLNKSLFDLIKEHSPKSIIIKKTYSDNLEIYI